VALHQLRPGQAGHVAGAGRAADRRSARHGRRLAADRARDLSAGPRRKTLGNGVFTRNTTFLSPDMSVLSRPTLIWYDTIFFQMTNCVSCK
jgi:hypothetical protein